MAHIKNAFKHMADVITTTMWALFTCVHKYACCPNFSLGVRDW